MVSSVSENNDNNVKYKQYDVYTTDGKLVEGVKQKATTSVEKGDFIKLNLTSDNYAEGVQKLVLSRTTQVLCSTMVTTIWLCSAATGKRQTSTWMMM